jgi:hypothetical protein
LWNDGRGRGDLGGARPRPLPERGLALETEPGVQLQSLGGRPLAALRGLDLAPDQAVAHKTARLPRD